MALLIWNILEILIHNSSVSHAQYMTAGFYTISSIIAAFLATVTFRQPNPCLCGQQSSWDSQQSGTGACREWTGKSCSCASGHEVRADWLSISVSIINSPCATAELIEELKGEGKVRVNSLLLLSSTLYSWDCFLLLKPFWRRSSIWPRFNKAVGQNPKSDKDNEKKTTTLTPNILSNST